MPIPLVPPIINTVCPGLILALPTSMCQEVIPTIDIAAASSKDTLFAIFATFTSGKWVYWQYPPHRGPVWNPHTCLFSQSYSLPEVHILQILQLKFA